jgi:integrase/recombinase XerD
MTTAHERLLASIHPLMREHVEGFALRGRDRTAGCAAEVLAQFHRWAEAQTKPLDPVNATTEQLEAYQDHLVTSYRTPRGKPLARSTASMRIAFIKGWYRWLTDRGHLIADPSRHLGIRVVVSRVVMKDPLSLQEVTALVQTAAGVVNRYRPGTHRRAIALRNLAAIGLTLATGRRISGLANLTVAQLNLDRHELRVEKEKGHVGRVLPVAGWAVEVATLYMREGWPRLLAGRDPAEVPWLFPSGEATGAVKRTTLKDVLNRLVMTTIAGNADLTDLPAKRITWHCLRVSFATLLFQNGCDIRSVNELLLHRKLSTTAKYTPIMIEDLRQVLRSAHPRP